MSQKLPEHLQKLVTLRLKWVNGVYSTQFLGREYGFILSENLWAFTKDSTFTILQMEGVPESEIEAMWREYFEPFKDLSLEDRKLLYKTFEHEYAEKLHIGKSAEESMEEVVWGEFTREELLGKFNRNKRYTVSDVAAILNLDYVQAYRHIVPWLRRKGYKIGRK